jgi:cathepsin A (carboxypeptidase C)
MLGMFTENGPYNFKYNADSVNDRFIFEKNEFSWNNNANVLYLDQPIGTGFSTVDSFFKYRWSEWDVAYDFYMFINHFMQKYPEYKHRELYITGESFAGHYIPAIANFIHYNPHHYLNLQGLAIGNGWVDPFYQFTSYPNFAAENGLISIGHRYVLDIAYQVCQFFLILRIPILSSTVCMFTGMSIATPGYPDFNLYDIREPCVTMGLCYPDDHLWQVMNSYEYRELMNIPFDEDAKEWEMCATMPHLFLQADFDSSRGY